MNRMKYLIVVLVLLSAINFSGCGRKAPPVLSENGTGNVNEQHKTGKDSDC